MKRFAIVAAAVLMAGISAANVRAADEEMVANPAYQAWAKFKAGTTVTLKTSNEMSGLPEQAKAMMPGKMESMQTKTLDSVDDKKAVVTTQGGGSGMMMGPRVPRAAAGKGVTKDIPATIAKSKADGVWMPAEAGDAKITNVKEGTDKIEVGGKTLETKTREMDIESTVQGKAQKSHVKLWYSETVPGGTVKMIMDSDMNANGMQMHMTMTTTLEKFEAGK